MLCVQRLLKRTDADIRTAVKAWCGDWGILSTPGNPVEAEAEYGHISYWNVSEVTDMNRLFHYLSFNEDISQWKVHNVTNMQRMFFGAQSFNQDLSNWNVGNVINMGGMFCKAQSFDQDLSSWNLGSVTNMKSMFAQGCPSLERNPQAT